MYVKIKVFHTVTVVAFEPDVYVGSETFCAVGEYFLGDANGDG